MVTRKALAQDGSDVLPNNDRRMIGRPHARAMLIGVALVACDSNDDNATLDMSEESPVTYHQQEDPELVEASRIARNSFKQFWKEAA